MSLVRIVMYPSWRNAGESVSHHEVRFRIRTVELVEFVACGSQLTKGPRSIDQSPKTQRQVRRSIKSRWIAGPRIAQAAQPPFVVQIEPVFLKAHTMCALPG